MSSEEQRQVIDQIIDSALAWCNADNDRPDPVPPEWAEVIPLLRAAPRLRGAAGVLLTNLIDAEEYGPTHGDACEEDNLPCDEDGDYWYSDVWELNEALAEANAPTTV